VKNTAVYALAIIGVRNYGWAIAEPAARGGVSKALGAAALLALLWLLYKASPSRAMWLVFLLGAFEELQTIICSVAYTVKPWAVPVGESICSARIDFDLGAIGVMLLAFTLHRICQPIKVDSAQDNPSNAS
jgi:hypothetical protein